MAADLTFTTTEDVSAGLHATTLIPPAAPATLGDGEAAELRNAMARFSPADVHPERRRSVDDLIATLDPMALTEATVQQCRNALGADRIEAVAEVAFTVPTRALGQVLELDGFDLVADVRAVVEALGRGRSATEHTDAAAARLIDRARSRSLDPVAAVSLLYQNHDATAALIVSHLAADGGRRRSALARTVRVATEDSFVAGRAIHGGQLIVMDLESSGFEFGTGPHHCPGRALAEAIAEAVVRTLADDGYGLDRGQAVYGSDGRATALPLRRQS